MLIPETVNRPKRKRCVGQTSAISSHIIQPSQRTFSKMQLTPIAANQTEIETADARIFFSYRTPVAAYVFGRGYVKSETWYSSTTSRHINKWMGKDIADTCDTVSETFLRGLA